MAAKHIKDSNDSLKILEVGPCVDIHFEELKVNWIKENYSSFGHTYHSLDLVGEADFIGSIENTSFENESYDVVIALSVLEHVDNLDKASIEINRITRKGGKVFLQTPFLFKIHGPLPDNWRISEYAYKLLFSNYYNIEMYSFPDQQFGKNSLPLSYGAILTKK